MKRVPLLLFLLLPCYASAQLLQGELLFEKTLYPAAVEKLTAARQLTSDPDELREIDYLLAAAAFQLQEPDVLYILEDYAKQYPDARHSDKLEYLAGCLRFDNAALDYALGRYPQALAALAELKQRDLFTHHAAELLMYIYFTQGDYAQALQESLHLDPLFDDPETHRIIGESYYRLGNKFNARPHLQIYVDQTDEPRRSSDYLLALCLFEEGELHKAVIRFHAVADNQTDTLAQSARLYIIQSLLEESLLHNARSALEDFLLDFPRSPWFPFVEQRLAALLLPFAKEAFLSADYDTALPLLARVIDIAEKYKSNILPTAYFFRAEIYYRLGNYSLAEKDYRLAPSFPEATYGLAYCFFKRQDYNAALPLFKQYATHSPIDTAARADALNRAADCLFHARQFNLAALTYQQAADLLPLNADYPLFQKAFILGLQKDYLAKVTALDNLLRLFPHSPRVPLALFEKGRAFVMLNNLPSAAAAFDALILAHPHSPLAPKAAVQLGLIYFNQGRLDIAIDYYKRVLFLYPHSPEAPTALHDLKSVYIEMNDVKAYTSYVASLGGSPLNPLEEDTLTFLAAERLLVHTDKAPALTALQRYLDIFPQGAFHQQAQLQVHYLNSHSLIAQGRFSEALPDLEILSRDTHTPQGAEAKFLLAQYYFDQSDDEHTLTLLEDFASSGTSHAFWLARAFILWADLCIRQGDPDQARVFLLNLQSNYAPQNDSIPSMILHRLNSLQP